MIKVENIHVYNIANAVFCARNPLNSWGKSDSDVAKDKLGENDLKLAQKLYNAGPSDRKFMRQIFVSMDVTAPLYYWKENDQYKVSTTTNSCSTMHTLHKRDLTIDDFSHEHLSAVGIAAMNNTIGVINTRRKEFAETRDKEKWYEMIQLLGDSFNQKRTLTMSYENVVSMIHQRSHHKLDEWREFCDVLKGLPYIMEITQGNF